MPGAYSDHTDDDFWDGCRHGVVEGRWTEEDAQDLLGVIGLCRKTPEFYGDAFYFNTTGNAIVRVLSRHGYDVSIDGHTGNVTTEKKA